MNLTHLLVQNILSIQSLSLLISQLILDGGIDTVKVVYDSDSLSHNLFLEINHRIPSKVQFLITNIADTSENREEYCDNHKWWIVADRILQLIFIDTKHMNGNFEQFSRELNSERNFEEILYRLYVIFVSNESNTSKYVKLHPISNWNAQMSSILAVHDLAYDRTELFLFPNKTNDPSATDYPIYVHNGAEKINANIFNLTLNYWYRKFRIISFYIKEYQRYEHLNLSFEVFPQKNAHLIACLNTVNNQFMKGIFQGTLVEERLRSISKDSVVSFKTRLFEIVKNPKPPIYDDIFPKFREANLTEL